MQRWCGKSAVVTGASAGIGAAICVALADAGLNVVGFARRPQLVDKLSSKVKGKGSIKSVQCDVGDPAQVAAAFQWVEQNTGGADLLVNNAGVVHTGSITVAGSQPLSDGQIASTIDVNLKGVIFCTRHAVASMKKRGVDGHIILINSIAGHYIPSVVELNVYTASKHAVTALTASLLNELALAKSNIKVTSLSPGLVETAMTEEVMAHGTDFKPLQPEDIADAVLYVVSTPPSVNITEITVQPVQEKKF